MSTNKEGDTKLRQAKKQIKPDDDCSKKPSEPEQQVYTVTVKR